MGSIYEKNILSRKSRDTATLTPKPPPSPILHHDANLPNPSRRQGKGMALPNLTYEVMIRITTP